MSKSRIDTFEKFNELLEIVTTATGITPNYANAKKYFALAGGEPNAENFWIWRELIRSSSNSAIKASIKTNISTVFNDEPWLRPEHFIHVSTDDNTKIAYTPNAEKGLRDIQVKMAIGRYLQKYYSDTLSNEDIKKWADRHREKCEEGTVYFAVTGDEIEEVYTNGPSSCMSKPADYPEFETKGIHPSRSYAGPDTVVAYTKRDGRINARAVCHIGITPPRYSRIYGDSVLASRLEEQGFVSGSLEGARLAKIPVPDRKDHYVICYLDGSAIYVNIEGDYIRVMKQSDFAGQRSSGAVYIENPGSQATCACCGKQVSSINIVVVFSGESVCNTCRSAHYINAYIDANRTVGYVRKDETITLNGSPYTNRISPEELGFVKSIDGTYISSCNAVAHYLGGSILKTASFPVGDGIYAQPSEINRGWKVTGPAYNKTLIPPSLAEEQEETLEDFMRRVLADENPDWGIIASLFSISMYNTLVRRALVAIAEIIASEYSLKAAA